MSTPSDGPSNPLKNGHTGKISVGTLVIGAACFAIFIGADTIQFVATGHESGLFQSLERASGGVTLLGLIGTLLTSYLKGRQ